VLRGARSIRAFRFEVRLVNTEPLAALTVPVSERKSVYPGPLAARVAGRVRRRLGDHFGLTNFGINLTALAPGAISALLHHHSTQDEFVYIVAGTPMLVLAEREFQLRPGDCCGFRAGADLGHQLANRSAGTVLYLEVGDRSAGDRAYFPNDDLCLLPADGGAWIVTHKDGTPY
jgi:uncharacterized cupin superfamily protein